MFQSRKASDSKFEIDHTGICNFDRKPDRNQHKPKYLPIVDLPELVQPTSYNPNPSSRPFQPARLSRVSSKNFPQGCLKSVLLGCPFTRILKRESIRVCEFNQVLFLPATHIALLSLGAGLSFFGLQTRATNHCSRQGEKVRREPHTHSPKRPPTE